MTTDRAAVRPLPRVRADVVAQMATLPEAPAADLADVGSLAAVFVSIVRFRCLPPFSHGKLCRSRSRALRRIGGIGVGGWRRRSRGLISVLMLRRLRDRDVGAAVAVTDCCHRIRTLQLTLDGGAEDTRALFAADRRRGKARHRARARTGTRALARYITRTRGTFFHILVSAYLALALEGAGVQRRGSGSPSWPSAG